MFEWLGKEYHFKISTVISSESFRQKQNFLKVLEVYNLITEKLDNNCLY